MSSLSHDSPERRSPGNFLKGLQPEFVAVIVFFALAFLANGLPRMFTSTVATTLFLDVFGSEMLPYTYIGAAIVIPLVGYLFLRLEQVLPFGRLLFFTMLADLGVLIALWVGLSQGAPAWLIMASMIWVEVEWVLVGLVFWGMAERIFDIRQAKRLFGVIGSGEAVAVVLTGMLMPVLVDMFEIVDLLWFSIIGVGTGCVIVYAAASYYREDIEAEDEDEELAEETAAEASPATAGGMFEVLRNPYIVLLFALSGISMFTYFCIDNAFFDLVESRYTGEAELASFLGLFGAWTGAFRLICASFLFGWLMKRHGVALGLQSLPIMLLAGTVLLLIAGIGVGSAALVFFIACFIKLNDEALRDGVDATVFRLLYQPLRPQQRIRAEAVEESFLEPIAGGGAGLLLLLLIEGFGFRAIDLFGCVAVMLLLWLALVRPVHRAYLRMLASAISKRTFGAGSINIDDDSSRAIVMAGLEDEHASKVIYSLHLLQHSGYAHMETILAGLLAHPAAEVRKEVLVRIEALRPGALAAQVRERVDREALPELKGAALIALAAIHDTPDAESPQRAEAQAQGAPGQQATIELLLAHLDDEALETRSGALVGLMLHGGIEGIVAAGESFLSMVNSDQPDQRIAAAGVLESLANHHFSRSLVPLLNDQDIAVRRRALHAARTMAAPQLYPLLGQMLGVPALTGGAAMALIAGGELAIPYMARLLGEEDSDIDVRKQALEVLGRIGGAGAVDVLLEHMPSLPESLRYRCLLALDRSAYHADATAADAVIRCMEEDADIARTIGAWLALMGSVEAAELTCDALHHELFKYRHRIFLNLGFLNDQRTVRQAWRQYTDGSLERRAYAVEIIDNLVPRPVRRAVLAALENDGSTTGEPGGETPEITRVLASIGAGEPAWAGVWLRATSLLCLARVDTERPVAESAATIIAAIESGPWLLRETGLRALVELDPANARERLGEFAGDPSFDLASTARTILQTEGD